MGVTVSAVAAAIEALAPLALAEPWDRPGLQVGDPRATVDRVLVALDPSPQAVARATETGAQLLLTHHPLSLDPLPRLDLSTPLGARVGRLIAAGTALYSAHTNLDRAAGGVNDALAARLGLADLGPLGAGEGQVKVVVTVPVGYEGRVRTALAEAGAGRTGRYHGCSFEVRGRGRFSALPGASPFLGEVGQEARVEESRLEVVAPRSRLGGILAALGRAHPYECPAVDVFPLEQPSGDGALGRVGRLPEPRPLGPWAREVAAALGAQAPRLVGEPTRRVDRVAVCGGSGAGLWPEALKAGAQVLVTGDLRYHVALEAGEAGLAVLDVGHGPSEAAAVEVLAATLRRWAEAAGEKLDVEVLREGEPWTVVAW